MSSVQREAARYQESAVREWFAFFVVSPYLITVLVFLLASRRIKANFGLLRRVWIWSMARANLLIGRSSGLVPSSSMKHEQGHCFVVSLSRFVSDEESLSTPLSTLQVFEDATPLGPAHRCHAEIRDLGQGRFSHWGTSLFFSSSDNTDPRQNGRIYTFKIGRRT